MGIFPRARTLYPDSLIAAIDGGLKFVCFSIYINNGHLDMDLDLEKLIETVSKFTPGSPLDKYISEVVFPNFKNIELGTRVTFDFPLTALVGANGSGKSSILHALWGMPLRQSTSRFWFSTAVDPITEGAGNGISRYYYSHWVSELKCSVQTRKVRGKKRLGYWESARALQSDGMSPMPAQQAKHEPYRTKERWNAVNRKVVYINFKCEFSAFDRFFYFSPRGATLESRQETILKGARRLRKVLDKGLKSYSPGGTESVFEHRDLTSEELNGIRYILGHDYKSAKYIFHRLYGRLEAPSVVFSRGNIQYSEAFAGSGELSVVRAVIELLRAEKYSLILLDEPETSLHPGAQRRFIAFLLEQIRTKYFQIVISTHSPTIVETLPNNAVKVLEVGDDGRARIVENTHPQVAFNRLGQIPNSRILIAVEDSLLRTLVEIAILFLDPGEKELIELFVPPGGSSTILTYWIPVWVGDKRHAYAILDGDMKPSEELPDPNTLTVEQQKSLPDFIKQRFKVIPQGISDTTNGMAIPYVNWIRERTRFLTAVCPEFVILEALVGCDEAKRLAKTNQEAKTELTKLLESQMQDTTAEGLQYAAKWNIIPNRASNRHILAMRDSIKWFLAHHASSRG